MFTDNLIAQALIDAKKRGVDVKIIVDNATMDYEYGKGTLLKENGIDVYVFSAEDKKAKFGTPLMHNKFAFSIIKFGPDLLIGRKAQTKEIRKM